jgi:serine-type D-Ala-D-Ala carboxypeptidase/endopeptidase (penicillin-binding protein 4)
MRLLSCSGRRASPKTPGSGLLLLLFLVVSSWVAAAAAADPSPSALRKAIEPIVSQAELAAATWGIEVRSLKTGKTLYALNAAKAFRPASAMKLVTTAAALDAYGPDARPRTTLETAARLDSKGRLLGDVFLVGRGDPNISARFSPGKPAAAFEAMAAALLALDVKRIDGRLVGNEAAFTGDRRGASWTWEDLAWGYGTEVSALSFADNLVNATLLPGDRVGDPAALTLVPDSGCLNVASTVATMDARPDYDEITLLREPGSNDVRLTGRLPLGGRWEGELAVADPAACAAAVFASVLEARGIRVGSGVATSHAPLPEGVRVLAAYDGLPMAQMIRVVNKESQNLHAEMLLRLVGLKARGQGSAEAGAVATLDFAKRHAVPTEGWSIQDGSGLSRTDLVTPAGLAALLVAMDRHPAAAAFRDSLPIAGVDGTLEKRLRGTAAEKRVLAKTGTSGLMNALAGYVTTVRGERLAFAAFVNNNAGRSRESVQALDRVAVALAEAR